VLVDRGGCPVAGQAGRKRLLGGLPDWRTSPVTSRRTQVDLVEQHRQPVGFGQAHETSHRPSDTRPLLVEPRVPLTEIDTLVFDAVEPVLGEHFVDGPGKSLRIRIRERLVVIEKESGVVVFVV